MTYKITIRQAHPKRPYKVFTIIEEEQKTWIDALHTILQTLLTHTNTNRQTIINQVLYPLSQQLHTGYATTSVMLSGYWFYISVVSY